MIGHFNYWWYYFGFGASACIMLLFACVYYSQVIKNLKVIPNDILNIQGKEVGLFECLKNRDTCLYTTFCMPVVAGKNYHATEVLGFWPGCIFTFLSTYSPLYFLMVFFRALLSMKVQKRLGSDEGFLKACCLNTFCMPCDIGRESMEVDQELGATISCCCNLYVAPRMVTEAANVKSRLCA